MLASETLIKTQVKDIKDDMQEQLLALTKSNNHVANRFRTAGKKSTPGSKPCFA